MTNKFGALKKDERIDGKESSHVILYSDDYDHLENSKFNSKVCMLTFWTGYLYFPGGEITKNQASFEDNIIDYVKRLMNFDISKYKGQLEHVSSYYIAEKNAVHTYSLKINPKEMAALQMRSVTFDENDEPDEESMILLETCGINKFNVSADTLQFVNRSNFGPGVQEDFAKFVSVKLEKKFSDNKHDNEIKQIEQEIGDNKSKILDDVKDQLENLGLGYLLDQNDERRKAIIDENGNFKDDELSKLLNSGNNNVLESLKAKSQPSFKPTFNFSQKKY